MRRARLVPIVALIVVAVVIVVASVMVLGHVGPFSRNSGATASLAPDFTLTDINGNNFTLSQYRNSAVVVVEFTALSCSECQIVEQSLQSLTTTYNQTGPGNVRIISVFIEPQFGDTIPRLKDYQAKNNVSWTMAQDTPSLAVSTSYGINQIPTVITIDKQGHPVYDVSGAQTTSDLRSSIASALSGHSTAISIVTVSVFGLAAVAGVSTFFSPCAFPMFPGYMSLYLGLNTTSAGSQTGSGTYRGAARRALLAGSVSSLGMMIVFLLIGVALLLAASVVGVYIPYFLIVVGVVLVGLGLLLFTNLQYWRIVRPFQALWSRIRGRDPSMQGVASPPTDGKGFYLKLFGYGMGYAAAAAGCVAPVIFSAIVAGMALGLLSGIVSILIFSLTAAFLMILITVMLAIAGRRYINLLKAYTPLIKKVSAAVLVVVGAYLIYFYYVAWVA